LTFFIDEKNPLLANFISLEQDQFTLLKGERKTFSLKTAIPENTKPGEYMGALIAYSKSEDQLALSRLDIIVEGSLSKTIKASLERKISNDKLTLIFNIQNTGNVKIDSFAVNTKIKNVKLEKILSLERAVLIPFDSVLLPDQTITLEKELDFKLDPIGNYFIEAEIDYGGVQKQTLKQNFSYKSIKKIVIYSLTAVLTLIILAFSGFKFINWYLKKRQRIKKINERWNQIVDDLLTGKALKNNTSLDEKTLKKLTENLKKEVADEIKKELKKTEGKIGKKIDKTSKYVKENIEISKMTLANQGKASPKYLIYMGKKGKQDYKQLASSKKSKNSSFFFKRINIDKKSKNN
jgi:F0F1-type ATP synthase membrane subunit b/b'